MEKTNNAPLYWYVFYNDQLLLQKKADGYAIPFTNEVPVTVVRSLPVEMQDGTAAMAAFTDVPLEETDVSILWDSALPMIISTVTPMTRQGKRMRLSIGINTAGFVRYAERRRN